MWSLLFSQEKMYLTMPLSGQAQGGAAGGLSQEQTPLLPSKSWIRQKADCSVVIRGSQCNSGWKEPWAGLALSSDPVCSGPCPGGFWNLPGTEGGWQLLWTSCVAAYMWEGFSWYKAGMSLLTVYGLSCCHAPLQNLMVLFGDPSWYCQAALGSPPRSLLLRLNQPCSPSLSSHHKCSIQVPASWGPMLNSSQFINICFVLWGPKAEQTI